MLTNFEEQAKVLTQKQAEQSLFFATQQLMMIGLGVLCTRKLCLQPTLRSGSFHNPYHPHDFIPTL